MCLRRLSILLLLSLCFLAFPFSSYAATFTLQNAPTQIGTQDEYAVDVMLSISVEDGTIYYLRGAFYKSGTSNYCGYTWNGSDWFHGPYATNNGWKNLLKITIVNHSWQGQLKAKVDSSDSGCSSSGTYQFRIERFNDTSSDGAGTFSDTQNEQTVRITIPTPTPTPQPTPTNTPTPTPTKIPTATSIPFPTPTHKPTNTLVPFSPYPKVTSSSAVLGTMSALLTQNPKPTLIAGDEDHKKTTVPIIPLLFILAGFCLLGSCGILVFFQYKKDGKLW